MANEQENVDVSSESESENRSSLGFNPDELPEVKLAKLEASKSRIDKGIKKLRIGLGIPDTDSQAGKEVKQTSGELDYGLKGFLVAKGLSGDDEMELFKKVYQDTGKKPEDILENKYFKADLKDLRDSREVEEALPKGSKRSTPIPKDSVDYWINKPFSEVPKDMQRKVLNAQIEQKQKDNRFARDSVITT